MDNLSINSATDRNEGRNKYGETQKERNSTHFVLYETFKSYAMYTYFLDMCKVVHISEYNVHWKLLKLLIRHLKLKDLTKNKTFFLYFIRFLYKDLFMRKKEQNIK